MEGSGIGQFIPLILIFVIFYFFLIRPQQKKLKSTKQWLKALREVTKKKNICLFIIYVAYSCNSLCNWIYWQTVLGSIFDINSIL